MIDKPKRLPKDWFWRTIVRFDPDFANKYTEKAIELVYERKKKKKEKNLLQVTPAQQALLDKFNVKLGRAFRYNTKAPQPRSEPRKRQPAKDLGIKFKESSNKEAAQAEN